MHLNYEDTKRWEKIYCDNNNRKKIGVAVFISDKDIRAKSTTRDKEGHFVIILKSIQQEDLLTIYTPNKKNFKTNKAKSDRLRKEKWKNPPLWIGVSIRPLPY